jgi:hypothetical protein
VKGSATKKFFLLKILTGVMTVIQARASRCFLLMVQVRYKGVMLVPIAVARRIHKVFEALL